MIVCECGRVHTNINGKRGKVLQEAVSVIMGFKGEFQAAEASEKINLPPNRVNNIIAQMRGAGIIEVAGTAVSVSGNRACFTYRVAKRAK